jgi:hypothetical protein
MMLLSLLPLLLGRHCTHVIRTVQRQKPGMSTLQVTGILDTVWL